MRNFLILVLMLMVWASICVWVEVRDIPRTSAMCIAFFYGGLVSLVTIFVIMNAS
jgi:hypothetical protein